MNAFRDMRSIMAICLLVVATVTCNPEVVKTPSLNGDPREQVRNSIAHWFQSVENFSVKQVPLTSTLQRELEGELRRNQWPHAYQGLLTDTLSPTDQLRFVELGSEDPRWRHFYTPLPSQRWFRSVYNNEREALEQHTGTNLFLLFRAPAETLQNELKVAKLYAIGVVTGIERTHFEEVFRQPNEADDRDVFYLHHVSTYLPESLQVLFTARQIHP